MTKLEMETMQERFSALTKEEMCLALHEMPTDIIINELKNREVKRSNHVLETIARLEESLSEN